MDEVRISLYTHLHILFHKLDTHQFLKGFCFPSPRDEDLLMAPDLQD